MLHHRNNRERKVDCFQHPFIIFFMRFFLLIIQRNKFYRTLRWMPMRLIFFPLFLCSCTKYISIFTISLCRYATIQVILFKFKLNTKISACQAVIESWNNTAQIIGYVLLVSRQCCWSSLFWHYNFVFNFYDFLLIRILTYISHLYCFLFILYA